MALFTDAFIEETINRVAVWHQELSWTLGHTAFPAQEESIDVTAPLHQQLSLLMQIANGTIARGEASVETVKQVEIALDEVLQSLLGNALHTRIVFPADFWQSDLGVLISRVRWWLWADDLITISNAAALAFGENTQANRMRIARAMLKGQLAWIPDPSVANPQQNRRVLRSQVERLREQSTLPE